MFPYDNYLVSAATCNLETGLIVNVMITRLFMSFLKIVRKKTLFIKFFEKLVKKQEDLKPRNHAAMFRVPETFF